MTRNRITLAVAVTAALGLTACTGQAGPSGPGGSKGELVDGQTFTYAVATDPGSLDPHSTVLRAARGVNRFLYGQLINLNDKGDAIPFLAQKWTADTTTATFTLRPGLTCSDGSPLTATQVADNFNHVGDPAKKSPLLNVFVKPGTKATADDAARTVTVTSGAPDAFLLRNLGTLPIACGKGLTDRKRLTAGKDGTGMFVMSESAPNDHYTLTRRKDITWGPGDWDPDQRGLPDKVVIRVIPNETTSANLLLSGEINAAAVNGPDKERLLAQKVFHDDTQISVGQLWYNQADGRPGQDSEVRRALTQALDLNQIGQVLTGGTGKKSTGMVTVDPKPCTDDTVSGNLPEHDTAAAAKSLEAAGWVAGSGGVRAKDGQKLKLTVLYPTQLGPTEAAAAELIQKTWAELGVDVTLKGVDSPGLNTALFDTGEWDVSMAPVGANLPSVVVGFVSGPVPPGGTNFAHIDNQKYSAAVAKAANKVGAEGCPEWAEAEKALIDDIDAVPYYNTVEPTFGAGAEFRVDDGLDPASIRMYK
ncbi:ABC transporter substrate-binding protein [Streptomyces sp. NPDC056296]|uniref:ABC transporter substrate-binding protein n=1 Tax=Streptomyces sp. NPDC056296 TaxID=3345775 RepID=UPI0035D56D1C